MKKTLFTSLLGLSLIFISKNVLSQSESKISFTGIDQIQLGIPFSNIKALFDPTPIIHYNTRFEFETLRKNGENTKQYEAMTDKRTYKLSKKNTSYFTFWGVKILDIEVTLDDAKKVMEITLFSEKSAETISTLKDRAKKEFGETECAETEDGDGKKSYYCLWEKNPNKFLVYDFEGTLESTSNKFCWIKYTNTEY